MCISAYQYFGFMLHFHMFNVSCRDYVSLTSPSIASSVLQSKLFGQVYLYDTPSALCSLHGLLANIQHQSDGRDHTKLFVSGLTPMTIMDKKGDKKVKSGSATKSTTTSMDSGDPSGIGPAINTQPQTPPPLQRTNTGSSSIYRDDNGKLSPTKILKEFGSNLKDIPLLPSTRNYSRPKSAAKPVGDVKIVSGVAASKPKVNLAKLPDIKIETGHPAQILVDWMLFTVPFDETNKQSSCWWYGGDKYTIKEWRD